MQKASGAWEAVQQGLWRERGERTSVARQRWKLDSVSAAESAVNSFPMHRGKDPADDHDSRSPGAQKTVGNNKADVQILAAPLATVK